MRKIISTIEGVKYLIDIENNTIFEISDYCKLENSPLSIVGIVIKKEKSYKWGEIHVKYRKKWGCLNDKGDVKIPFIYDRMDKDFSLIKACIEEKVDRHSTYRWFYFDNLGIPTDPATRIQYKGWEWVEEFYRRNISVGQKDGKQGVIRKDGSIFVDPVYQSVEIDTNSLVIRAKCEDSCIINIVYCKECKKWFYLPKNHIFSRYEKGLYIIKLNESEYALDASWKMVIPPSFDYIDVKSDCCIVSKQGVKGLLSRKITKTIEHLKDPIYAQILDSEYEDIRELCGEVIFVKDSKQGLYSFNNNCLLLPPCIPIEYPIIPFTLSDGAIAYKNDQGYGFCNLYGNLLFSIAIKDDRITNVSGFKNGKANVSGAKHYYIFQKDGSYETFNYEKAWDDDIDYYDYEKEQWYALTDGMYGDYPEGDIDYEILGF